jgi:hypothetical protein
VDRKRIQRLQTIEDEQRPPLAGEPRQPPAFIERALRTACHFRVAEEGEGLLQKRVGRRLGLFPRALAVEGPCKHRLAPRPILIREVRRGLRVRRKGNNRAQGGLGDGRLAGQLAVERQITDIVLVECLGLVPSPHPAMDEGCLLPSPREAESG